MTNLEKGDVAHFYKIVEWVGEAAGNVKGWKVVSPFNFDLEAVLVGKAATDTTEAVAATGITATLANTLAATTGKTEVGTGVTVGDDKKAELDVTTSGAGIYMVLITPTNKDVVYNPVFVSSDYDITADPNSNTWAISELASYASTDAAAKKSTTTLTKEAKTDEVSPDDVKWITTAIGDTVHFTVKTTIPGFGNAFVKPFFKMTDKLTDLALVSGSVKIKAPAAAAATGAATITEHTTDYNIDNVKTAEYHFVNQGTEAQIKWTETPPVELPHQFVNTQGLQLPSTGGMGTTLLYVGGSILVLAAVILLVTKRRMSSEE